MATLGIITSVGIEKSIDLANGEGFQIVPYRFAVSATAGVLNKTRTIDDLQPVWYTSPITGGIKIDKNTVQFICNIPPEAAALPMFTREVYLIAKDASDNDFLLGFCQPTTDLTYDPEGELRIRLQFNLDNVDIADLYEFKYTQAIEIEDHNDDNNAHPLIKNVLEKHGIYFSKPSQKNAGQLVDVYPTTDNNLLDRDVVYFNEVAAKYNKAIADGVSDKRFAIGVYDLQNDAVIMGGVFDYPHSEEPFTKLFLSDSVEGAITLTPSAVFIGYTLNNNRAIVTITVTNEEDIVVDPDGDTDLLLNPPVVRELVLEDDDGMKWEVLVSNDGQLTTTETTKRLSSLFRVVRIDGAFGNLKVNTDGVLYTLFPGNPEDVIDNYYYMQSPNQNAWKISLDLTNQIVMATHSNRYTITASPYRLFEIRQLLSGKGTLGVPVIKETDLLQVQQTGVGDGNANFAFYDPELTLLPDFIPVTFNELREWTAVGPTIGEVKESYAGDVKFFQMNGNTWLKCNAQSCVGTKYEEITGAVTVPNLTNKYIKVN